MRRSASCSSTAAWSLASTPQGSALQLNRGDKSFTRIDAHGEGVVADSDNDGIGALVPFAPIAVARGDQPRSRFL